MVDELKFYGKDLRVLKSYTDELFVAEEVNPNLYYTVKQIRNPSNERMRNLQNEIKILKSNRNSHPNIISLLWSEESPSSVKLLFEYCNSGTIFSFNKYEPLKLFRQICLGVQYLHHKSIVHKNLTVHNILLHENTNFHLYEWARLS